MSALEADQLALATQRHRVRTIVGWILQPETETPIAPECSMPAAHRDRWEEMEFTCETCGRHVCGVCEGGSDDERCDDCWAEANAV